MRTGGRSIAWMTVGVSLVVLIASVVALGLRIESWHQANPKALFYAIRTDRMSFTHAGREVQFEPEIDNAGEGVMRVQYGDGPSAQSLELEV